MAVAPEEEVFEAGSVVIVKARGDRAGAGAGDEAGGGGGSAGGGAGGGDADRQGPGQGQVRVVGAEHGSARGLAVAAIMSDREMPWQRWHLVDSSLAELTRVAASSLPETSAFSSHYANWVPTLHGRRVRAEVGPGKYARHVIPRIVNFRFFS